MSMGNIVLKYNDYVLPDSEGILQHLQCVSRLEPQLF